MTAVSSTPTAAFGPRKGATPGRSLPIRPTLNEEEKRVLPGIPCRLHSHQTGSSCLLAGLAFPRQWYKLGQNALSAVDIGGSPCRRKHGPKAPRRTAPGKPPADPKVPPPPH